MPCKAACRFIRFGCYFGLKGQKNHKNQTFNSIQKLFSSFLPRISQVTIYKALVFSISVIVLMVPLLLLISSVRDSSAFIYLFWSIFLYNYCLQHNAMFFGKLWVFLQFFHRTPSTIFFRNMSSLMSISINSYIFS